MAERFLLVPMAALAETAGSFSRVRLLALSLRERGIEVATCCAHDPNYREIEGPVPYQTISGCLKTQTTQW